MTIITAMVTTAMATTDTEPLPRHERLEDP